ncbi:MAG: RecX family transcriptional regulator [Methylibium sp.]|uniref:regulatory protein RecX n=1 Tax=Methylibium sp. TaxID=2067992 RepID=UPI0017D8DA58|nr:RecX family transcriptional regulator [Methylibium sp.]MBA3599035.1 RecX family transcriptional regulator [Methylibium sp.]
MQRPALSLKDKALSLIAQREQSRLELRRKLLAHIDRLARAGVHAPAAADSATVLHDSPSDPPDERQVDELLDWLTAKDLLSAERFVETRVTARASRFGNLRIRQELAQHGLEVDEQTDTSLKASELPRAHAVWARRFGAPAGDTAGRAKQMRFLAARGFSAETVRRVVKGEGAENEEGE